MKIRILSKSYSLDSNTFEATFTFICMFIAVGYGFLHRPAGVALSLFNFLAMAGVIGFVVGFMLSGVIVGAYRALLKKSKVIGNKP